jgi:diadenosine tetraphosphatase ApaH/serine/threonine PP2A family protein phosphatase
MRYGIFSDVHSNLEAFEAVIEALKIERIDNYLCIGDIVGYAADPKECIRKTKQLSPIIVCGNHDWASVGLADIKYFNPVAKEALIWTSNVLDEAEKYFLRSLNLVYTSDKFTPPLSSNSPERKAQKGAGFILVHGTLDMPEKFNYLLDVDSAYQTFHLMKVPLCFVGHSHVPIVFLEEGGRVNYLFGAEIKIEEGKRYIVNVGSVGQPRDRDPRAAYCIFDTQERKIQIKRVSYDVERAKEKIIKAGLPRFLAERLSTGR